MRLIKAGRCAAVSGYGGVWGGIGIAFALFALFPNWLSSLPRSGGWMNTVKIVFGFVELRWR